MRLISFYQNLSYCRVCKKDYCQHNDKPLGIWHGRAKLFERFIGLEWNINRHSSLCLECEWFYGEGFRDVKFVLGVPFLFTIYLTLKDVIPNSVKEPWKKGPRQAAIRWNECGQFLKIDLGGKSHESSSTDKWWEKGFTFHAPWESWHLRTEVLSLDDYTAWQEDYRTYWRSLWDRLVRNRRESRTQTGCCATREVAEGVHSKKFSYRYNLKSGRKQKVTARVHMTRHTWCLRWFPFWKRQITSIWCEFNKEVGEGHGSYKGGVTGAGCDMLPGETMEACLRRMEATRKFDR